MSKHRVLSFKPQLRLEWRGQDGQSETEQPDHSASLGDSITSSTRIRFSVHTGDFALQTLRSVFKIFAGSAPIALQIVTNSTTSTLQARSVCLRSPGCTSGPPSASLTPRSTPACSLG